MHRANSAVQSKANGITILRQAPRLAGFMIAGRKFMALSFFRESEHAEGEAKTERLAIRSRRLMSRPVKTQVKNEAYSGEY